VTTLPQLLIAIQGSSGAATLTQEPMADGAAAGTAGAEAADPGAKAAADAEGSGAWAADAGATAAVGMGGSEGARADCSGDALAGAGDGMAGRSGDEAARRNQAGQS